MLQKTIKMWHNYFQIQSMPIQERYSRHLIPNW